MRFRRWRDGLTNLTVALSLAGCAAGSAAPVATTPVAVTDVASVAGKWTGLMELQGSGDRDDFVELTVDRGGTYRVVAARTIGLMDAEGKIAVDDGKLRLEGARGGRATGTLHAPPASPDRTLLVEGATPAGRRFSVRLRPAGGS